MFVAKSKFDEQNLVQNINKHGGEFSEGHTVLVTLSNADYYINTKTKRTVYNILQGHVNDYTFMYQCHYKLYTFYPA